MALSPQRQALESASTTTVTDLRRAGREVLLMMCFDRASADALVQTSSGK
jgi:hypothetical protein